MRTRNILALLLFGTDILTNGGLLKLLHRPRASVQFPISAMVQPMMLPVLAFKLSKGSILVLEQ